MHRFITISILQIANVAFVNQKTTNCPDARIPFWGHVGHLLGQRLG